MGTFAVFDHDEVPVELCITGHSADGIEFFIRVLAAFHSLHQLLGEAFQQIADMTGNKLSTITSRYRYALQSLRRELEANPIER